jgi:putative membrane protein
MFYESHYWGMNIIWWFLWVSLFIWIFALPYEIPGQKYKRESALDILKRRFALGEINSNEFHDKKRLVEANT